MSLDSLMRSLVPPAYREYERATVHAGHGLYTEAALRLGRATEAKLYFVARELGVSLTDRQIRNLEALRRSLTDLEFRILRKQSDDAVRALAYASRDLAQAIEVLARDRQAREGDETDMTRRWDSLFREILSVLPEGDLKRRLQACHGALRELSKFRNDAAHAAADGSEREISEDRYREMSEQFEQVGALLMKVVISHRATLHARSTVCSRHVDAKLASEA